MSFASTILDILRDPPPEFAFEVASGWIAMSRTRPPASGQHVFLKPGVIAPSPVRENITDQAAFKEAVRKLVPNTNGRGKRKAALILPDNAVRLAILDFDTLPEKEEERRPLINFRLRKSVPFDIDEAAISYYPQGKKVLVAVTPSEVIAHYEAPFRAAGLQPGFVTVSSLAIMDLLPVTGSIVLAHRAPGALTVMGINNGVVTIARSLEIADAGEAEIISAEDEIIAAIYPTLTYIEDNEGARPSRLYIAGFGDQTESSAIRLSVELDIPVDSLNEPFPGLAGYLSSLNPNAVKAAAA
jgi:type IV pilus assembly protein PilM